MENQLKHVAVIMDGNGRWAKKQNQIRTFGHKQGVENVRNIAIAANDMNIEVLTLYAFSTENWKRPMEEVDYLMKLPEFFFNKFMKELMDNNIRIGLIGEMHSLPMDTQRVLLSAIEKTKENTGLLLNFAMNYGSQREIILAAQKYANAYKNEEVTKELDNDLFESYLMTQSHSKVDLMIRTSGECRISNFLLWQLAYAELVFVDEAWPEFTPSRFKEIVDDFHKRHRRFGGL